MAIAVPALTYVLLPGAGGSTWYWHLVAPELRRRGHEVVAVDLPAGDDRAGLAEYADTVVAAIGDRGNVVLVAQSMAGFSAPLVCDRVPVSMLILVNAMIPRPGETPGEWWEATGQPEASRDKKIRDGRAPDAPFDPLVDFFHDVPQQVTDEAMVQPPPAQSDTPFASVWPLAAWPQVPTRVLVGRDDRLFPAEFQRRVAEERLGITPDEIAGGHLLALSQPQALVDQLEVYTASLRS